MLFDTKFVDQLHDSVMYLFAPASAGDPKPLAVVLLSMASDGSAIPPLGEETRAAIREGLGQARRGKFAADEEIAAIWNRHGL